MERRHFVLASLATVLGASGCSRSAIGTGFTPPQTTLTPVTGATTAPRVTSVPIRPTPTPGPTASGPVSPTGSSGPTGEPAPSSGPLPSVTARGGEPARAATGVDDTDIIHEACEKGLILQPGTYVYRGGGYPGPSPVLRGRHYSLTTIVIKGDHVIAGNRPWGSLAVEDLTFTGGRGAIRNTHTGSAVQGTYVVQGCRFLEYSHAAISHESSDMPYWKITRNLFWGRNTTTTMGVALSGLTDGCTLEENAFLLNRVHVKLARGGNNAWVRRNDFIQFSEGANRVSVWVVPSPSHVNSGAGLTVDSCKFGNENLMSSDRRILYADAEQGDFGTALPALRPSNGHITGHTVRQCMFAGRTGHAPPAVESWTPHVRACRLGPLHFAGSVPTHAVHFRVQPSGDTRNVVGPMMHPTARVAPTNIGRKAREV